MAYLLFFAICLALIISSISIWKYGNLQRQHPIVTLSVFAAWSFSFLIVFTIPLDVTSTVYRQCVQERNASNATWFRYNRTDTTVITIAECQQPWGMVPDDVFVNLWRIIYWSSQFLTWLIMPLMQSYLKAGDFTMKGKFRSALIDNAIYYGSYLLICGILLVYIAMKPDVYLDWPKLKAIASSASNTWGLFLLVLLFGYAIVEVPRSLWNNSKPGYTLQYAYFKASKLSTEKAEAEENVDDVLESLHAASRATPTNHERRAFVETILRKVPVELMDKAQRSTGRGGGDISTTIIPSEKALVRLHKQVIKSLQTMQRSDALWAVQVSKVLYLEDIARNQGSMDRRFKTEFTVQRSAVARALYSPTLDWYWQCVLKSPFLKALAVTTGLLSAMVVWSELTFFNRSPVLSIFAVILNAAKYNYDFVTIELCSMVVLCYLCYCAYSTVFRIKFLNLYYLAPHHQTNEHSLIFSGMLLCRLTPPMCLNFLGLIHMDSHIIKTHILETHYTQVMGHMDVIGIIADGFNIYFPMLMLGFCLATWFSVGSRTLNALGFQQFMLNETFATELVQEGRDLIAREKRRRQRAEEAAIRRNNNAVANKYRNGGAGRPADTAVGPNDGLLRDGEPIDYSSRGIEADLTRTLSQEINERFGASAHVDVGFRGYDLAESDDDSDGDGVPVRGHRGGVPPSRLFDDV